MESCLIHSEANGGVRCHGGCSSRTAGSGTSIVADVDGSGADGGVGVAIAADIIGTRQRCNVGYILAQLEYSMHIYLIGSL